MCLAPCFKGCTDEAYTAEVANVQAYFDTGGESLLKQLEAERERLSAELDFEGAAAQHTKIGKIKAILQACDEICGRLDRLETVIVQPSTQEKSVAMFRFHQGELTGPVYYMPEAEGESQPAEARIRSALEELNHSGSPSAQRFGEELAILKRWYYRSHKTGEIFFADREDGLLPMRRIVRGVGRVWRGEKEPVIDPGLEPTPSSTA